MSRIRRITFVWNADFSVAGGVRALKELVDGHHTCTLCGIAYHRVRQTADWKAYRQSLREQLHADVREPCRNQLTAVEQEAAAGDFPAVLAHLDHAVVKVLGSGEIDACGGDFQAFRARLDHALQKLP